MSNEPRPDIVRLIDGTFYIIVSCVGVFLIYFLVVSLFFYILRQPYYFAVSFNQEVWIEEGEKEKGLPQKRYAMIDDVMENHLKKGMAKEEVLKKFGKPDDASGSADPSVLEYSIGLSYKYAWGSYLYIAFNKKDEIQYFELRHIN